MKTTLKISIHAPCTGSDASCAHLLMVDAISIHAPCTGSDSFAGLYS